MGNYLSSLLLVMSIIHLNVEKNNSLCVDIQNSQDQAITFSTIETKTQWARYGKYCSSLFHIVSSC